MDARDPIALLQSTTSSQSFDDIKIRLDAEPDWENNPIGMLIAVRSNGQHTYLQNYCAIESILSLSDMHQSSTYECRPNLVKC